METSGRFKRCFVLGLALAALGGSAAQAGTRPDDRVGLRGIGTQQAAVDGSDVLERYVAAHPFGATALPDVVERYVAVHPYGVHPPAVLASAIRPPDVADAAAAAAPDVLERYVAAHAFGAALPDVVERYAAVHLYGVHPPSVSASPIRPPDVADSAALARTAAVVRTSGGFDWGDYGAGVGSGIGLILLLAGGLMARPVLRRQRTQTA